MKRLVTLVITICIAFSFTPLVVNANEDIKGYDTSHFKVEFSLHDNDQSQGALNIAAAKEFKRADDMLNEIYNKVLLKKRGNQEFIDKFIDAELAWIAFRDAEIEAIFPGKDKRLTWGSVYPVRYFIVKAELTWDRAKKLNQWLEGVSEGDITAGSRGLKSSF